jgi:hypothetical protein
MKCKFATVPQISLLAPPNPRSNELQVPQVTGEVTAYQIAIDSGHAEYAPKAAEALKRLRA